MAAPKTTIWNLEPRTRAKHEILSRYLKAWMPVILQGGFPEAIYIDGFAGPGRYSKGEDGSPIIALKSALYYKSKITKRLIFRFVEYDRTRAECLKELIDEMNLPPNFDVLVHNDTYENFMEKFLAYYRNSKKPPPPTFAFIDPFGWKIPFSFITELLRYRSCEVFVNFMYEEINRFLPHQDQPENFDKLFGCLDWRDCLKAPSPQSKVSCLHDLYVRQLHETANADFVRSFKMRNDRDTTDYFLFYATKNITGLKKMKEAMWSVDASGEFSFSDATDPRQLVIFGHEPNFELLRKSLVEKFSGQKVSCAEIERFVVVETPFKDTHYKVQVLKRMELEKPAEIYVENPPVGRRPGTYADPSLIISFK